MASKSKAAENSKNRVLKIDFLFLDEKVCVPCGGTSKALSQAVEMLEQPLSSIGIDLQVVKILVGDEKTAITQRFLSSPTIRINGNDIDPARTEEKCPSCAELAGGTAPVSCRNWTWQGDVFQAAPIGKIVEDIMAAALELRSQTKDCCDDNCCSDEDVDANYVLPHNLKGFFAARASDRKTCC